MDFLLKQRLVGAIVLVALGVIFIPMLLEGPDQTPVPKMDALPEPVDRQRSKPLGAFPAPDAIPEEGEESIVRADPEPEPEPVAEPQSDATQTPAQSLPTPEPLPPPVERAKKPATPAPALASWVVQAGSFSSQQNALRLRDKLRKAGFATQVEKAWVAGKAHYRVRVGPFLQRVDADKSRQQLLDKFALEGRVLSYP